MRFCTSTYSRMLPSARSAAEATRVSAPMGTNHRTARVAPETSAFQINGATASRMRTHTVDTPTVMVAMKDRVARISCGESSDRRGIR